MRFRHIFIVTYGRSGSTLITGIINSIPGAVINGENGGVLLHLFRASKVAKYAQNYVTPSADVSTHSWYRASRIEGERFEVSIVNAFTKYILKPEGREEASGFKEIRHGREFLTDVELDEYLSFIERNFDQACFIFNIRRSDHVSRSAWWNADPFVGYDIERLNTSFSEHSKKRLRNAILIDYDEIMSDYRSLRDLFNFLGAEYDEEAVNEVLNTVHSFKTTNEHHTRFRTIRSFLRSVMFRVGLWLMTKARSGDSIRGIIR